ncbi:MAG: hypothetical protein JW727_00585 [Candidatus Aenigmarchaeota archaeon]|nr:hypothetical protein [Candidatus Aenigmarchaeota archaeon]
MKCSDISSGIYVKNERSGVILPKEGLRCSGKPIAGLKEGLKDMYVGLGFSHPTDGKTLQRILYQTAGDYGMHLVEKDRKEGLKIVPVEYRKGAARMPEGEDTIVGYYSPFADKRLKVLMPVGGYFDPSWTYARLSLAHEPWYGLEWEGPRYSMFGTDGHLAGTLLAVGKNIARRVDKHAEITAREVLLPIAKLDALSLGGPGFLAEAAGL